MNKVTYFDVEYANSHNKSICQMGLLCEDYKTREPYFPEKDVYINPDDKFDDMCIKVHGITPERVSEEPKFNEVWDDIEKYFINTVVIGHNVASADLDALVKNLKRYNIDIPELYYVCTLELAREYIPRFAVENYSMSCLCEYFDIDIDSEHNAFDDACANSDLFKTLVEEYNIDVDAVVKKYSPKKSWEYSQYISAPELRKAVSDFFGVIRGFSIDNVITSEEQQYIVDWRESNYKYYSYDEIKDIIDTIDKILEDGIITVSEIIMLQGAVKKYLDVVSTSPITLSTQILNGIMKGIVVDGAVSEEESTHLRQWLYDNIYLSGHFPFDKLLKIVDEVLEDSVITKEESEYITSVINQLLNPVDSLRKQVNTVEGKHVCLSGNFAYGEKSAVEAYIVEQGGLIDKSVKKTTDILIVGNNECAAYSNGTYGTKVKKAMEYNEKGCNIAIVKETDFLC